MITKLAISNYRSIGEPGINIEIKPLTILLGPNGSGKSSILEAPCILMQKESGTFLGSLQHGELVNYPISDSIAHRGELNRLIIIEVHVKLNDKELHQIRQAESEIDTTNLGIVIDQSESIGYRYSHNLETKELYQSIVIGSNEIAKCGYVRTGESSYQRRIIIPKPIESTVQGDVEQVLGDRIFVPTRGREIGEPLVQLAELARRIIRSKTFAKAFLFSAFRGDVNLEGKADSSPRWVGKHGSNLIEALALIFGDRRYRRVQQKIIEWAEKFDISGLGAGWLGKSAVGADYVDSKLNTPLRLALAGYGSRQVMCIITQLFWSKSGDIIMVEEPEISLHPNSQAVLPELFADAITEGKQILVSTHSETVPLSLQRAIRRNLITSRDIAVYHVEKGRNGTKVRRLRLTKDGYVKGWIPSFAEVESRLLKEWAQTIPKYQK